MRIAVLAGALGLAAAHTAEALDAATEQELSQRVAAIEPQLIAWRRDVHQHPELSGQEARTAALVAAHLQHLGLAVTTGVGGTGVVGVLVGAHPGKVVALRADMAHCRSRRCSSFARPHTTGLEAGRKPA
jgi:amidohydrolase